MNYCFEKNDWGDRFIPELNRTSLAQQSASQFYDKELDFDPCAENTLTIVIGSDSGLLFKYLLGKSVPDGSRIVLLEPGEVFEAIDQECREWLAGQDCRHHSSAVSLIDAADLDTSVFNNEDTAWFLAGKVELVQSRCAISDYLNIYYPLYRQTRQARGDREHAIYNSYAVKRFIDQQMANCVDNQVALHEDQEFGKGRVALVMGGGPSLDQHLDWIIENRSRLFILAVSRLCGKLTEMNLMPDLVVSMDPSPLTYAAAKRGTQWQGVPLVHSYHVAHMLPKQWLGPRFHLGSRYPWGTSLPNSDRIIENSGPTVGHAATVVAAGLGFSTILLSGVDLCMNTAGDSHTQGTPEAELLKLPGNYDVQVSTYAGNRAGTSLDFYRGIQSLEKIGKRINQHADVLFNLNIHATAISSIKHIDCHDVELPDARPVLDCSRTTQPTLEQLRELRQQLSGFSREFRQIGSVCSKAQHCIDQIYGKGGKPPKPAYHKRLDALENRLMKISPPALSAIRYYMGPEYGKLRKPSGFSRMLEEDMEKWAREYYEITDEGSRYYQKALENAQKLIRLREAELSDTPDIEYLLQAWEEQETPGRVMMFLDRLLASATAEQQALLHKASESFLQSLHEKEKQHDARIVSNYGTVRKTMQSLRYLRNQNCINDLQTYSRKLQDLEWPYGTISTFINGSIAELNDDEDEAISQYGRVIDDCAEQLGSGQESLDSIGALIEDSLTRLTQIYIKRQDGESACSTLGMLCEVTPHYIPSYANLLNMMGNYESSVELLTIYLENFSNDWRAARQLAQIHEKAGNREAQSLATGLADSIRKSTIETTKAA
ncbi:6-hydroxymethylpterin diphosphokinase MptE-like protein [Granulosicoccus sp. 3-233]|uniref:6-hydroxymethylpterin diphosphokinase MptE-like protein n=1 Tax=Granulosicoccus sp. 3-233 TaxID=3417969 RepID=UPI003D33B27A